VKLNIESNSANRGSLFNSSGESFCQDNAQEKTCTLSIMGQACIRLVRGSESSWINKVISAWKRSFILARIGQENITSPIRSGCTAAICKCQTPILSKTFRYDQKLLLFRLEVLQLADHLLNS